MPSLFSLSLTRVQYRQIREDFWLFSFLLHLCQRMKIDRAINILSSANWYFRLRSIWENTRHGDRETHPGPTGRNLIER